MFFLKRYRRTLFQYMWQTQHKLDSIFKTQTALLQAQLLSTPKYADPRRLEHFGYKVYSQNDEDGILNEIFNRIGTKNKFFVEFGVQDGLECNSHFLLLQGWRGVFMEGSKDFVEQIKQNFANPIQSGQLKVLHAFITRENINELMRQNGAAEIDEIDLLSIDIDGNDYHIFEAISCIHPRVIVTEYNAKFPPPARWVMPYEAQYCWDSSDKQGASLQAFAELGEKKGYVLVGTNLSGVNAFFVRKDLLDSDKFALQSPIELYNPMRPLSFCSGHTTKRFLDNAAL